MGKFMISTKSWYESCICICICIWSICDYHSFE